MSLRHLKKIRVFSGALYLIVLFFLLFGAGNSTAKELHLASSTAIPPYVIVESGSGIELDVVREALKLNGYTVIFEHLPFPRAVEKMKSGEFDGALTIAESARLELGQVYYSDSHIVFENCAVSLKSNNFEINDIAGLADKSIGTFQFAKLYLGPEFEKVANSHSAYRELPNTTQIVPMLFQKRVEVIVLEQNIFKYVRKKIDIIDTSAPVVIHRIFPDNPFKVVFLDKKVQMDFNSGLKIIRENGRYNEILNKYTQ